jgi:methylglutaconyl-CoA hydratase
MAPSRHVELNRQGAVATVLIRRPQVHNAFNERTIGELQDAFRVAGDDVGTRLIILAGEGTSFSAGADLDWMRRAAELSEEENQRDAEALARMLRAVADCPCPVVARVQGSAFGGGAGLVAAADIAIAGESARFGFTETRLGLVPATIAPYVVEKIGAGWALRLFLTGERFGADRASAIGLVYRVVTDAALDAAVDEVVTALLAGGPEALRTCKQLIRQITAGSAGIDEYTSALIARVRSSEEGREGIRAFLEKRKPRWVAEEHV